MTSLTKLTKEILKHKGLSPKKYFSQNFLVDKGVYDSVIAAGDINDEDYVGDIEYYGGYSIKIYASKNKYGFENYIDTNNTGNSS